ncbi:hypothetical protein PVA46_07755 [Entomospira culicis]|nr:hypothetical protein [Entomospira culicis]WDI37206.1 hypothetical protein PVA46_07755 [Entomospira culicis]
MDSVTENTTISLRYVLVPEAKLDAFRANPNQFVPILNKWSLSGALGKYNYLQHDLEQSTFFFTPHLRWLRLNFTDRNAPTMSYSGEGIPAVTNELVKRIKYEKPFSETWSLQDADVISVNKTFPELAVKAGEKFYLLILFRVKEMSRRNGEYFYTYTLNLDNLEKFYYTMNE